MPHLPDVAMIDLIRRRYSGGQLRIDSMPNLCALMHTAIFLSL